MNKIIRKPGLLIMILAVICAAGILTVPALARSLASHLEAPTTDWMVNNTGDSSGSCVPESCSLRQAITAANASAGSDLITFNIPTSDPNYNASGGHWLITLSSALPALGDDHIAIDAHTQPLPLGRAPVPQAITDISSCGAPRIVIDATVANYGIEVTANNFEITGVEVFGAQLAGISIHGLDAANGFLLCNRITANNGNGVSIASSASQNTITYNLISGNSGNGIGIFQSNENSINGNYIGVDVTGLVAWSNGANGISINGGAISNTVTAEADSLSVISGNILAGVRIEGSSTQGNLVRNSIIGAGSDQQTLIPNKDGVYLSDTEGNEIANCRIAGNSQDGVVVTGGADNYISNNQIGTNDQMQDLGNARFGVLLDAESSRTVLSENAIVYNGYLGDYPLHGGVAIQNSSSQNILNENEIAYNAGDGVLITGSTRNLLDRNSIHDNTLEGINLESGGNDNLRAPHIKSYLTTNNTTAVIATAAGCPDCVFQVFSDSNGEGQHYEGSGFVSPSGALTWRGQPKGETYTLTVTDALGNTSEFSAAPVYLDLSIDDALPHVTVNKLIGDTDGTAGQTIVEVAVKITGFDASLTSNMTLTLNIPGNVLGAPARVFYRDEISSLDGTAITSYTNPASGVYKLKNINLNTIQYLLENGSTLFWYERLIVFRFAMPTTMTANSQLVLNGLLSAGVRQVARSYDWARINAAKQVDGILITNRTLLYHNNYQGAQTDSGIEDTTQLLQTAFSMAQGPPYENRAPVLAVYYVDQYSTTARDWDDTAVNYASTATANVVSDLVNNMKKDWFEDSTTQYTKSVCTNGPFVYTDTVPNNLSFTILILGDDYVIPYYRSDDPVDDIVSTVEDDEISLSDQVLYHLAANNYFFTDNPYADLYQGACNYTRSWFKGGVEAYIGRIVGGEPADMERLINSGLSGPGLSQANGAIVASYDENDADDIAEYMSQYPLNVFTYPLVDEDDWSLADLRNYMGGSTGWVAFAHGGHANNVSWCTPGEECNGLYASHINAKAVILNTLALHPVVSSNGCRSGMSLGTHWSSSTIYGWARAGASSIMASTGIAYFNTTEGISWYGEKLARNYWYNLLMANKYKVSTGFALQLNKSKYTSGAMWDGYEQKTVREFTLFGLPWVGFYQPAASHLIGLSNLRDVLPPEELAWPISKPAGISAYTYVVTATLDASAYTISQVNGFDLVNIEGMQLDYGDDGPVVPFAGLSIPLPMGSSIQEVQVSLQDALSLGALNIPLVAPAVPMPGGTHDTFSETPDSYGVYPSQLYSATVATVSGSALAQITVFPLEYNAVTDQATLYQQLVVSVTYQSPSPVGILGFSAEPANAAVGESLHINATLLNASDLDIEVSGVLTLTNSSGVAEDTFAISPFNLPAGSQDYPLELEWTPTAAEGAYHLELEVWHGSDPHMYAQQSVAIVTGRLSGLEITPLVIPGQPVNIEVTFENFSDTEFNGQVQYAIYNSAGLQVAVLEAPVTLAAHGQAILPMSWDASALPPGAYTVTVLVSREGGVVNYGPLQQEFWLAFISYLPRVTK
ncbi:MAG: right-handed parallel beta-helix repeat-containing protein [Anaerolineales bacterium]|nr:right-handed parallel beta-helix repeat-containing protein [Anaerolineales bacterium]